MSYVLNKTIFQDILPLLFILILIPVQSIAWPSRSSNVDRRDLDLALSK